MKDLGKEATRVAYGKTLLELGKKHSNIIVLDADLSCSTKTSLFAKEFPLQNKISQKEASVLKKDLFAK